jgi:four helix bundle protein
MASEAAERFISRTRAFALSVIELVGTLPNKPTGWVLGKQVLRSGTSIGANYREAQRARSDAEFLSKIQICRQEAEETCYWLDLLLHSGTAEERLCRELLKEATQLSAILGAIAVKVIDRTQGRSSSNP